MAAGRGQRCRSGRWLAAGRLTRATGVGLSGSGTSVVGKLWHLAHRAWKLLLVACERPRAVPGILRLACVEQAHVGEVLKLYTMEQWLKGADIRTVLDVGAHHGEFASAIMGLLPEATVYAFEPLADGYQKLLAMAKRCPRLTPFQVALGTERGEMAFWRSSYSASSSLRRMSELHKQVFPWTAKNFRTTVRVAPLDDYAEALELRPRVLMKVDVQGWEDRVFRGAARLMGTVDYILVEVSFRQLYEDEPLFDDVYQLLTGMGFQFAGHLDQVRSPIDGGILQADALFVRRSPADTARPQVG